MIFTAIIWLACFALFLQLAHIAPLVDSTDRSMAETAHSANSAIVEDVGENTGNCRRPAEAAITCARQLFPRKVAVEVAVIAKVSVRTAERWVSGEYDLSADALGRLLRSEWGFEF